MDWDKAKSHFDKIRQTYLDLEGVTGVNTSFALRIFFEPLAKRYSSGERSLELYDEMMRVK